MADYTVSCPNCNAAATFSEFAQEDARVCPACRKPIATPPPSTPSGLRMGFIGRGERSSLLGQAIEARTSDRTVPILAGARLGAAEAMKSARTHSPLVGFLVFLLVAAPVVGLLYLSRDDESWRAIHRIARWAVLGIPLLLVLAEAFHETTLQGLLCLFLPAYVVWYALTRVDKYWLQSLACGALLLLGLEYWWLREEALVVLAGDGANRFFDSVSGLIRRAGEAGIVE